jgi:predicted nucleic acid-binding protein
MTFVLDSSLTIAWFVPDEHSTPTQLLLARAADSGAVVPDFWRMEIGNALILATRRNRLTLQQRATALRHLESLPIDVDSETSTHAWGNTMQLAERFRLTLYDACYLELAQRRNLPIATLDKQLRIAGRELALPLLGV